MKNTLITGFVALLSTYVAHGVTNVGLQNFKFPASPDNGWVITDNAGNPLNDLNIAIGTAAVGSIGATSSVADIRSAFTPIGSESFTVPDNGPFLSAAANQISTDSSPQDGSVVFVALYNGSDFASSTGYIVFEGDGRYIMEDAVLQTAEISVQFADSNLVYGTQNTADTSSVVGPRADFTRGVTFQLVPIPEPSTSLLAAFASLGLVARRRRS